MLLVLGAAACDQAPRRRPESFESTAAEAKIPNSRCKVPAQRAVILERDGAVLETWTLRLDEVANDSLPDDPAFLAYRAAIERDRADVRRPAADPPIARTEAEEEVWRNEHFNNELVFRGAVGSIDRISCLDALLFARQASRISQIDQPTEFLASVLKRKTGARTDLVVVFGAGSEMFPPREVYGFEIVVAQVALVGELRVTVGSIRVGALFRRRKRVCRWNALRDRCRILSPVVEAEMRAIDLKEQVVLAGTRAVMHAGPSIGRQSNQMRGDRPFFHARVLLLKPANNLFAIDELAGLQPVRRCAEACRRAAKLCRQMA